MRVIMAFAFVLAAGCLSDGGEKGKESVNGLRFKLSPTPGSNVTGFTISIYGPAAACPVASPLAASATVLLAPINFPTDGGVVPTIGHRFADTFVVVPPGLYCAEAIPLNAAGTREEACTIATGGPYEVVSSRTREIILISNCSRPDNGGLGATAVVNDPPVITEIDFDRGMPIGTCQTIVATATGTDPNGDAITYSWRLLTQPSGDSIIPPVLGNTFSFRSFVAGDFDVEIKACDEHNLCTLFVFTIRVAGEPCSILPDGAVDAGHLGDTRAGDCAGDARIDAGQTGNDARAGDRSAEAVPNGSG